VARERATDPTALVWAAARVFEEKGYRSSTIDDIAEAAGVSRPTVYKYTASKRALLDHMVDVVTGDLTRRLEEVLHSELDVATRFREAVSMHVAAATEHRNFYAILFSEHAELSAAGRRRFSAWAHQVALGFQALLSESVRERGGPAGLDTWVASNLILSMLTSLYRWYDPERETGPEELTEQILLVVDSLVPPHSSAARETPRPA
jgi:TetR/AcrR family transcriptional regulator, cholesterol catabolism regulator